MRKFVYITVISAVIGSLFLFPTKQFLTENNLLLGLSYNDHILVGTLAFIVALAALYKLFLLRERR